MSNSISSCISSQSFTRFGFRILIRNETSHTHFQKSEMVLIKELRENGFVLELPANVCQRSHNLTIFFLALDSDIKIKIPHVGSLKEARFEAVSKVEKVEAIEDQKGKVTAEINFIQYDSEAWKAILKTFAENQEKINHLLNDQHLIRGEDE